MHLPRSPRAAPTWHPRAFRAIEPGWSIAIDRRIRSISSWARYADGLAVCHERMFPCGGRQGSSRLRSPNSGARCWGRGLRRGPGAAPARPTASKRLLGRPEWMADGAVPASTTAFDLLPAPSGVRASSRRGEVWPALPGPQSECLGVRPGRLGPSRGGLWPPRGTPGARRVPQRPPRLATGGGPRGRHHPLLRSAPTCAAEGRVDAARRRRRPLLHTPS